MKILNKKSIFFAYMILHTLTALSCLKSTPPTRLQSQTSSYEPISETELMRNWDRDVSIVHNGKKGEESKNAVVLEAWTPIEVPPALPDPERDYTLYHPTWKLYAGSETKNQTGGSIFIPTGTMYSPTGAALPVSWGTTPHTNSRPETVEESKQRYQSVKSVNSVNTWSWTFLACVAEASAKTKAQASTIATEICNRIQRKK